MPEKRSLGGLIIPEQTAPGTPASGGLAIYAKTDGILYYKNDGGTESRLVSPDYVICTSSTRPASPYEGLKIYETDTDIEYTYTGSAWIETCRYGDWTSWTPTFTTITKGTGFVERGAYVRSGMTCHFRYYIKLGTGGSASGSAVTFVLPFTPQAEGAGSGFGRDASGFDTPYVVAPDWNAGSTTATLCGAGSYMSATTPFTWTVNDTLRFSGTFEIQ